MEAQLIQTKINQYLSSLPDYGPREYKLRMSGAGECPRLQDYLFRDGVGSVEPEHIMRMHTGTYLHTMWRDIKAGALGSDYYGCEEEIKMELNGVDVLGHPDGIYRSLNAVDEFKSVSNSTYEMIRKNDVPIPAHYEQANTYAGVLGCTAMLIHYFNKDNGQSTFMYTPFNPILFDMTKIKFITRLENKERGVIEARPYSDQSASPCWYCPKKEECYSGFSSEVQSLPRATFNPETETELFRLVNETSLARKTRLDCEKKETDNKLNISKLLLNLGVNACDIGQFSVELKIGKNNNPLIKIEENT